MINNHKSLRDETVQLVQAFFHGAFCAPGGGVAPVARPRPEDDVAPGLLAEARAFCLTQLKGKGRRLMELVCNHGGRVSLYLCGADEKLNWPRTVGDRCHALMQRLNRKFSERGCLWRVHRFGGHVLLREVNNVEA